MNAPLRNPYSRSSKLPRSIFNASISLFAAQTPAHQIAKQLGLSDKTAYRLVKLCRERIAAQRNAKSPFKPLALDPLERRVRGRRLSQGEAAPRLIGARVAYGELHTEWVAAEHCSEVFSWIYRARGDDLTRFGYQGVIDLDTHRIRYASGNHALGSNAEPRLSLENLRSQLLARMKPSYGMGHRSFYLCLKEVEWRLAQGLGQQEQALFKLLRDQPI